MKTKSMLVLSSLVFILMLTVPPVVADIVVPWLKTQNEDPVKWPEGSFPLKVTITGRTEQKRAWVKEGMERWDKVFINPPFQFGDFEHPDIEVELVDKIEVEQGDPDGICHCEWEIETAKMTHARIEIEKGLSEPIMKNVASHEAGHALGFDDNPDGNIMNPATNEWPPSDKEISTRARASLIICVKMIIILIL